MRDTISPRQAALFAFASASAPVITVCAGLHWLWALAATLAAGALTAAVILLWRRVGEDLPSLLPVVWGRAGNVIALLAAVFAAAVLWRFFAWTDTAFPDLPTRPFVPLTLLAIAAFGAWKGSAACIRAVTAIALPLAALYAAVFLFALPDAQPQRLVNLPRGLPPVSLCALLLPVSLVWFAAPGKGRPARLSVLLTALLPAVTAAVCASVPGSGGSLYVMAENINVLSVGSRIEPLVSAALTVGWFAAVCLPLMAAGRVAERLTGRARVGVAAASLLALPGTVWDLPVPGAFFAVGTAIFCGLIPLLTLWIAALKKSEKKMKKAVDNSGSAC
ncbi:MAG: hypothetical protein IJT18_06400 [Oscillospiraceae bacterium]|nr:hypothetical protein [Oscillospiraceae bacterium]